MQSLCSNPPHPALKHLSQLIRAPFTQDSSAERGQSISSSAAAESSEHHNNHRQLGAKGRADALKGCSSPSHVVVRRCGMHDSSVAGCLHRKGSRLGTRWSPWSGPGRTAGSFRVGKHAVFKCRMGACLCCALPLATSLGPDSHRLPYKRTECHICPCSACCKLGKKIPQPPPREFLYQ